MAAGRHAGKANVARLSKESVGMNESISKLRLRMMSVAYRMLGGVAVAEDAVQDAFLRL